jgi:hypothetical protein
MSKQIYETTIGRTHFMMASETEPSKDDFIENGFRFPVTPQICEDCRGEGTHLTPGLRYECFTEDDFAQDPDFEERYWNGGYDVECRSCEPGRPGIQMRPNVPSGYEIMELGSWPSGSFEEHLAAFEGELPYSLTPDPEATKLGREKRWAWAQPHIERHEKELRQLKERDTSNYQVRKALQSRDPEASFKKAIDDRIRDSKRFIDMEEERRRTDQYYWSRTWENFKGEGPPKPLRIDMQELKKYHQRFKRLDNDMPDELQELLIIRAQTQWDDEQQAAADRRTMYYESGGQYGRLW